MILAEQDFEFGGTLLSGLADGLDGGAAEEMRSSGMDALRKAGARLWNRTTVFGLYDHGVAGLIERVTDHLANPGHLPRERMRIVRAGHIVLATGAVERPFAFGNNDRPGVMLASAAATYVNRFAVAPGRTAVLGTNNDSAYDSAIALAGAGITTTLLDARAALPAVKAEEAEAAGVTVRSGLLPIEANGARGVSSLDFGRHLDDRDLAEDRLATDFVGVSGGWTPVVHLISHRGIRPVWNDALSAFVVEDTGAEPVTMGRLRRRALRDRGRDCQRRGGRRGRDLGAEGPPSHGCARAGPALGRTA